MNRILFKNAAPEFTLDSGDPRFEHVRGVLRMKVGDRFDIGVENGPVGKATLMELDGGVMRIKTEWGERPPLPAPVHLMVGMCRPATARKILSTAPTLGVRSLTFTACGRSDLAYGKSSLWTGTEWRARLIEGVEQAFDTFVPAVSSTGSLEEGIGTLPEGGIRLALDVYEGIRPLTQATFSSEQPVSLAIGPERGWNRNDRTTLKEAGFEMVSLDRRVLRVETAVTVGLTLVLAQLGVF